jgi:hypothetical protein
VQCDAGTWAWLNPTALNPLCVPLTLYSGSCSALKCFTSLAGFHQLQETGWQLVCGALSGVWQDEFVKAIRACRPRLET